LSNDDSKRLSETQRLRVLLGRLAEGQNELWQKLLGEYDRGLQQSVQQSSQPTSMQSDSYSQISQSERDAFDKTLKQMPSKPSGYWAFADKPESAKLVAILLQRPDRTIIAGSYRYTLSKDGKFLSRWPHSESKESKT